MYSKRPLVLVLALVLAVIPGRRAAAQQAQTPAVQPASQPDADETRQRLEDLLRQYPPTLPQVLRLDPTLLNSPAYLQPYPALAAFLTQHPEVTHNPGYFFADYGERNQRYVRQTPPDRTAEIWRSAMDGIEVAAVVFTIAGALLILIRMLVDYRRWSRLTKIQTDAHTKLLDRFASNEDLLGYIQTPAGRRFLESSPISIDSPRSLSAPFGRILWSTQAGAVLTVLGLGIEMVARGAVDEVAAPLGGIGALVIALGVGFLVSAVLAYFLSRRFGLVDRSAAAQEPRG
ncbi:MAG TPA: hypothetical protein VGL62_16415 [Vicinamibacterales bacterium]|jgi:hypothetical protein